MISPPLHQIFTGYYLEPLELGCLNDLKYCLVGNGGYSRRLINLLRSKEIQLPKYILSTDSQTGRLCDIDMIPLESADLHLLQNVVLGSDVFQKELISKIRALLPSSRCFDVADDVHANILKVASYSMLRLPDTGRYGLFITLAHSGPMRIWLDNFSNWLKERGFPLIVHHPMELLPDKLLNDASFILVWNGVSSHFDEFHTQIQRLGLTISYVECGFFPQNEHFYLDRNGVNAASQLMNDPLDWLTENDFARMETYRQHLFNNRSTVDDDGSIFVPLQVESDSNIQLHSRFQHGMQDYIDFVASKHPNDKLVFKPHPKDHAAERYHYHHGKVSPQASLTLIAKSRLVRGINSSVLFEAALAGKPVISDGESLLNHPCEDPSRVVCAMIARQFHVSETQFSLDKLLRFSHLGYALDLQS